MLALVGAEQGLRVVLLERERLGGQTSAAWFGILHGGLRYLQSLDVPRLRQSVLARRWFMTEVPHLLHPQPFLMPLYNRGMKRPDVFRAAFVAERLLTTDRNRGVPKEVTLPPGQVLNREQTLSAFPEVITEGLTGAALWYEAVVPNREALIAEIAIRAGEAGVEVREGTEAIALLTVSGAVAGVLAAAVDGQHEWRAPLVVNCTGPWAGELAQLFDPSAPSLFHPALGFNFVLDLPAPSELGLSLTPPGKNGPMLFLYPQNGRCFAGTWYAPWTGRPYSPAPDDAEIEAFLSALNASLPCLGAKPHHIVEITAGLLPANTAGAVDLVNRDQIYDHSKHGGPAGLWSLAPIKFTTARQIAKKILRESLPM